jgi:hypothetical protein
VHLVQGVEEFTQMVRKIGRFGRSMVLCLAATGMMMAAGAASAQAPGKASGNKMLAGLTAEEIISILTENQIQAQKAPLPGNDPLILALMPNGAKFFVRLQKCGEKGVNCQVVQYGAIFTGADISTNDFNTFNATYAFGKSYKDPQNQMYIEHAVAAAGGIRRGAVEANMYVFLGMFDLFSRFLAERMSLLSASADGPADKKSGAITNSAGSLPVNSSLASFRDAAAKHPEIINKVSEESLKKWKTEQ